MAKAEKPEIGQTEPITMRISSALLKALMDDANPFGISRTQLIHRAIEEYVQNHRDKPADDQPRHPRR